MKESAEMNEYAYKWARYLEISWPHAFGDILSIRNAIGWDKTREYCERRIAGDKISLNQFCEENDLPRFYGEQI